MADRLTVPMLHTVHGSFDEHATNFYAAHGHKATLSSLSHAQAATCPVHGIVPNPIERGIVMLAAIAA